MKKLLLAMALIFGVAAAPVTDAVAKPKKEHVQKKNTKKKKLILLWLKML